MSIISDNGPQFISNGLKEYIRISGMTHVRTSPYYPQSNGKLERWHKTVNKESIRPCCPLNVDDARRIVGEYVAHYNTKRLHSAIGYVTLRTSWMAMKELYLPKETVSLKKPDGNAL